MYTKVALKYNDVEISELFISVYKMFSSNDVKYCIAGLPFGGGRPVNIGLAGSFTDVNSAFECIKAIAEKYPYPNLVDLPIDYEIEFPEFIG